MAARIAAVSPPAMGFLPPRRGERVADLCVLGGGLVLGLVGAALLIAAAFAKGEQRTIIGASVYVAGLLAMLCCSLLYRAAIEARRRQFLRRLDHAAIFALIAGTATPFALGNSGLRGIALVVALWVVAAIGIAVKLCFPIGGIGRSVVAYLMLGWASLVALGPAASEPSVVLIAVGGIFYSLGVRFLLWRRLPYRLAIWHAFVLAGAICHYFAIMIVVAHAHVAR